MGFPIKLWGCPVTFPLNQSIDTWYNLCSVVHSTCCLCICIRICKHKTQDHQWQLTHVYPSNACVTHYITRDINPRWAVLIIEESSNGHINMDGYYAFSIQWPFIWPTKTSIDGYTDQTWSIKNLIQGWSLTKWNHPFLVAHSFDSFPSRFRLNIRKNTLNGIWSLSPLFWWP